MYNPQLETFIRVADAGSFNKAAEELFISPPAVIKQINLLEAQLGLTLFVPDPPWPEIDGSRKITLSGCEICHWVLQGIC